MSPVWLHRHNGTLFDGNGNSYRARLQELAGSTTQQGRRLAVFSARGVSLFRVEHIVEVREPRGADFQPPERRVLADAGRRLSTGQWRVGETYQVT